MLTPPCDSSFAGAAVAVTKGPDSMKPAMLLRTLAGLGPAMLLAGCGAADEYAIPRKEVYLRLARIQMEPSPQAPFGNRPMDVRGNGLNRITFGADEDAPGFGCIADLAEPAPGRTKIKLTCHGAAGEGASDGMAHSMMRNSLIELIDASIDGRAYQPGYAAATAAGWPGDGNDGSYAGMVASAIKMDADIKRDIRESEMRERESAADRAAENPDPATGMEPSAE